MSGPQRLVEQQGLQQLRTPLSSPSLADGETPPHPLGPTLLGSLSADTPIDDTASTAVLQLPGAVVVLLVAATDHSQEEQQEAC